VPAGVHAEIRIVKKMEKRRNFTEFFSGKPPIEVR
jgi:hypothetical protein